MNKMEQMIRDGTAINTLFMFIIGGIIISQYSFLSGIILIIIGFVLSHQIADGIIWWR